MAVKTMIPRSIRPQSGCQIWGVGKGSGSTLTGLYKMGTGGAQMVDLRARADTASGSDARIIYARMHQYGAGGGEAIRAYAFTNYDGAAYGGTLNGIHASLSIATSSSISGAGNAIRATLEAAAATRTLGGTLAAIQLDSNIGANNTVPATASFLRVTDTGSVKIGKLLNIPAASNSTIFATHTTEAMTHSIRITDAAGTPYFIMCTNAATNRGGGS